MLVRNSRQWMKTASGSTRQQDALHRVTFEAIDEA
jgi:hypothetical protein